MAKKGQKFNNYTKDLKEDPMESFHRILKKETLYDNYITSFEEYLQLVEDWLIF